MWIKNYRDAGNDRHMAGFSGAVYKKYYISFFKRNRKGVAELYSNRRHE
jgi:hypothetical protein